MHPIFKVQKDLADDILLQISNIQESEDVESKVLALLKRVQDLRRSEILLLNQVLPEFLKILLDNPALKKSPLVMRSFFVTFSRKKSYCGYDIDYSKLSNTNALLDLCASTINESIINDCEGILAVIRIINQLEYFTQNYNAVIYKCSGQVLKLVDWPSWEFAEFVHKASNPINSSLSLIKSFVNRLFWSPNTFDYILLLKPILSGTPLYEHHRGIQRNEKIVNDISLIKLVVICLKKNINLTSIGYASISTSLAINSSSYKMHEILKEMQSKHSINDVQVLSVVAKCIEKCLPSYDQSIYFWLLKQCQDVGFDKIQDKCLKSILCIQNKRDYEHETNHRGLSGVQKNDPFYQNLNEILIKSIRDLHERRLKDLDPASVDILKEIDNTCFKRYLVSPKSFLVAHFKKWLSNNDLPQHFDPCLVYFVTYSFSMNGNDYLAHNKAMKWLDFIVNNHSQELKNFLDENNYLKRLWKAIRDHDGTSVNHYMFVPLEWRKLVTDDKWKAILEE
ncbi:hypothetical protein AKO1_006458 [Acrasis kona]|uniref:Uncharacterized protein n=1 Tax=Acrasis kona TaxID=1008807 RepID=A0AAW2ZNK8_9EUKA